MATSRPTTTLLLWLFVASVGNARYHLPKGLKPAELDAVAAAEEQEAATFRARALGDRIWRDAAEAAHEKKHTLYFEERRKRAERAARAQVRRAAEHRARATVADGLASLREKRAAAVRERAAARVHGISIPAFEEEREASAAVREGEGDLHRARAEEDALAAESHSEAGASAATTAAAVGAGTAAALEGGCRPAAGLVRTDARQAPPSAAARLQLLYGKLPVDPRKAAQSPINAGGFGMTAAALRCQLAQLRSKQRFLSASAEGHRLWGRFHRLRVDTLARRAAGSGSGSAGASAGSESGGRGWAAGPATEGVGLGRARRVG